MNRKLCLFTCTAQRFLMFEHHIEFGKTHFCRGLDDLYDIYPNLVLYFGISNDKISVRLVFTHALWS